MVLMAQAITRQKSQRMSMVQRMTRIERMTFQSGEKARLSQRKGRPRAAVTRKRMAKSSQGLSMSVRQEAVLDREFGEGRAVLDGTGGSCIGKGEFL